MPKISGQNLGVALGQYLEQELAPKADGVRKVILYMAIPVVGAQAQHMVEQYKPALSALGALTEDGMIDLDVLYPRLKEAVRKTGKVPMAGIIFDESDVDKIHAIAQQYAQQ